MEEGAHRADQMFFVLFCGLFALLFCGVLAIKARKQILANEKTLERVSPEAPHLFHFIQSMFLPEHFSFLFAFPFQFYSYALHFLKKIIFILINFPPDP